MERQIVSTENAPKPVGPYSQAVKAGNILFVSGQIPINPATGKLEKDSFEHQCRLVLNNLKAII